MSKQSQRSAHQPEHKIGPFAAGIGVAIWLNRIETDDGPRYVRSLTINPRRYRDASTGEWKDAASFRPADLPALWFAIQEAMRYVYTTPIPGQEEDYGPATY